MMAAPATTRSAPVRETTSSTATASGFHPAGPATTPSLARAATTRFSGSDGDDGLSGGGGYDALAGGAGSDRCTSGERLEGCER
jgi:Ca2+-binding RTX toxin-like protein